MPITLATRAGKKVELKLAARSWKKIPQSDPDYPGSTSEFWDNMVKGRAPIQMMKRDWAKRCGASQPERTLLIFRSEYR